MQTDFTRLEIDLLALADHRADFHAKKELEALDPGTLTGKRKVMGRDLSVADAALAIGGDLHEHLGQLIAYARTNHIVPPWSK